MISKIYQVTKEQNGITKTVWYYTYFDVNSGKEKKVTCKNCKSYEEAVSFFKDLKRRTEDVYLISNIVKDMYLPNSDHLLRMKNFGKLNCERTIKEKRHYIDIINEAFGSYDIRKLKIRDIENYLIKDRHSGSWKNTLLETFCTVYDETIWVCPKPVPRPYFKKFARNSKKADILNSAELNSFFNIEYWDNIRDYTIFKVIASCGLRLGEARALKLKQFLFNKKVLVINGFCKYDGKRTNYNKCGNEENTKSRIAPLQNDICQLVLDYAQKENKSPDEILFTNDGRPLPGYYLEGVFEKQLEKAAIRRRERKLTPHSLRFTYVTRMRRMTSAETVQKIVGHTSVNMTEYYTRYGVDELIQGISGSFEAVENLFE